MAHSGKCLKRRKFNSRQNLNTISTNYQLDTKINIKKACSKVSHEANQDFKKKFQLLNVPECIKNCCKCDDRFAQSIDIKQISLQAEQSIKTEFKSSAIYEALEICVMCITPRKYLSADVLKNIVEVMMNAHEDLDSGYTINFLLKKCQHTLMIHFNMHPPCVKENVRSCYNQFINAPFSSSFGRTLTAENAPSRDLKKKSKEKVQDASAKDKGIVSHCFSRLMDELDMESEDGTIINEQKISVDIQGVKLIHWKKENLEVYEFLVRTERIERCMLVLESVIYLIQTDLALCDARLSCERSSRRSQRPLLANLLWPGNSTEKVTPQCRTIVELFAYYIHLQYPERHIKTMVLWMNAVAQMFCMYGTQSGNEYPFRSEYVAVFVKEFHKFIESLPHSSILKILERIEPTFIRYLIGLRHTQNLLQNKNDDILNIIIWCFNTMSWENYCVEDHNPTCDVHPTCLRSSKNTRLKPGNLMDCLLKKTISLDVSINVVQDAYPKLELKPNTARISQNHIIDTMIITFVAYLDAYSIEKFLQTLNWYNENENNCDSTSCKSVGNNFVNKYSSLFNSLQELSVILSKKQCNEPLQKLADLLNLYFPY